MNEAIIYASPSDWFGIGLRYTWQATLTRYKGKVLPSVRVSDPGLLLKPDEPNLDGKTLDNELEVVEGMKLDRGYISLISSPTRTIRNELENPLIIIHEKKISSINDVVKVLELVLQVGMTTAHR
ncbi:heat shock protein 60 [Prunus dulcis]|uniref:Heat shock protein 60 n=1 Tax=Prunus dulcis TaxID=3755 RepID=A0A4Y1REH0_PRUDU|nr:heat shock protein 60 [Prunus dulcis]